MTIEPKARFTPPKMWPKPPRGYEPEADWSSQPEWLPMPVGWVLFFPPHLMTQEQREVQEREEQRRDEAIARGEQVLDLQSSEGWLQSAMRKQQEAEAAKRQAGERSQAAAERKLDQTKTGGTVRANISSVGDRSSGILACPKCGGTGFKAKRRGAAKGAAWLMAPVTLGLTAAAMAVTPKTRVQCVTCKTEYLRG